MFVKEQVLRMTTSKNIKDAMNIEALFKVSSQHPASATSSALRASIVAIQCIGYSLLQEILFQNPLLTSNKRLQHKKHNQVIHEVRGES